VLTDDDIKELIKIIAPDAAVLTSIENSDTDTASDTDTEEHSNLPEPLTALFDGTLRELSPQELQVKCEDTFHRLKNKLQHHQCERLEFITRQQSTSKDWQTYRAGRITSTRFYRVATADNHQHLPE